MKASFVDAHTEIEAVNQKVDLAMVGVKEQLDSTAVRVEKLGKLEGDPGFKAGNERPQRRISITNARTHRHAFMYHRVGRFARVGDDESGGRVGETEVTRNDGRNAGGNLC